MIDIKYDFTKTLGDLEEIVRNQVPFATSLAMNRTLTTTRQHIKSAMDDHIEGGPTPFTRSGMRVYATSKYNLHGAIAFTTLGGDNEKSRYYMKELMYSGKKKPRRDRIPEPVIKNMKKFAPRYLTPRGNIRRDFYTQARAKGNKQYFIGIPKPGKKQWAGNDNLVGIWRRDPESGKLNMMVSLKRTSRQQRKTFPAPELARKFYDDNFPKEMREAFVEAIRTIRTF